MNPSCTRTRIIPTVTTGMSTEWTGQRATPPRAHPSDRGAAKQGGKAGEQ
jgi:hypothetical protein